MARRSNRSLLRVMNRSLFVIATIATIWPPVADYINKLGGPKIPEKWNSVAFFSSIGLWVAALVTYWLLSVAGRQIMTVLRRGIEERYAHADEVDLVYKVCCSLYHREDHIINKQSLQEFMKANSHTAKIFYKNGGPVGIYIVFSINREAVRRYLDGSFTNAQQLHARNAISDRGKPTGLYVTNVAAEGLSARGMAVESLKKDIAQRIHTHRSIEYVFGRMANEDGSRILRKAGFYKIHPHLPDEQVWQYHVPVLTDLEPEET